LTVSSCIACGRYAVSAARMQEAKPKAVSSGSLWHMFE
jgi:hypothetical protein